MRRAPLDLAPIAASRGRIAILEAFGLSLGRGSGRRGPLEKATASGGEVVVDQGRVLALEPFSRKRLRWETGCRPQ